MVRDPKDILADIETHYRNAEDERRKAKMLEAYYAQQFGEIVKDGKLRSLSSKGIALRQTVNYLREHGPTEETKVLQHMVDNGWVRKQDHDRNPLSNASRVINSSQGKMVIERVGKKLKLRDSAHS